MTRFNPFAPSIITNKANPPLAFTLGAQIITEVCDILKDFQDELVKKELSNLIINYFEDSPQSIHELWFLNICILASKKPMKVPNALWSAIGTSIPLKIAESLPDQHFLNRAKSDTSDLEKERQNYYFPSLFLLLRY